MNRRLAAAIHSAIVAVVAIVGGGAVGAIGLFAAPWLAVVAGQQRQ